METTRIIEQYLEGTLGDAERGEVEQRAERDEEFRELIRLHQEVNESIRDKEIQHLRALLKKVSHEYVSADAAEGCRTPVRFFRLFSHSTLRIAAILIGCLIAGYFMKIYLFNPTPEVLYQRFYTRYEPDIASRAAPGDAVLPLNEALWKYHGGSYAEALVMLDEILRLDQHNYLVWFFRGLVCLEMDDPEKAIRSFGSIPEEWQSLYNEHRNWYLALALLKVDQPSRSSEILQEIRMNGGYYASQADQLLRRLRK
jgi:tetratricopeptide (TPR) repeat protein